MKKRFLASILSAALAFSSLFSVPAAAEDYPTAELVINGERVEGDIQPVIYNSRTMVPIIVITDNLGCNVQWNGDTKTVTISSDDEPGTYIYMTIGSNTITAESNGESASMDMDTAPIIINGRTMLPVAIAAELFGYSVQWDGETKTAYLNNQGSSSDIAEAADSGLTDSYNQLIAEYNQIKSVYTENENILMSEDAIIENEDIFNEFCEISDKANTVINENIQLIKIDASPTQQNIDSLSEAINQLKSCVSEMKSIADKCGITLNVGNISLAPAASSVQTDNSSSVNTSESTGAVVTTVSSGEFNPLRNVRIEGTASADSAAAKEVIANAEKYMEVLSGCTGKMTESVKNVYDSYAEAVVENIGYYEETPDDNMMIIFIYNSCCVFGAMAEAMGVDVGENLKEYDVTVTNPVYSSTNIKELSTAYNDSLERTMEYKKIIRAYFDENDLRATPEYYEFDRICDTTTYYESLNIGNTDTVEYNLNLLKLQDKCEARIKIFAEKYNIAI